MIANLTACLFLLSYSQYVPLAIFIRRKVHLYRYCPLFISTIVILGTIFISECYQARALEKQSELLCKLIRNHTLNLPNKMISNREVAEYLFDFETYIRKYSEKIGVLGMSYSWPLAQSVSQNLSVSNKFHQVHIFSVY